MSYQKHTKHVRFGALLIAMLALSAGLATPASAHSKKKDAEPAAVVIKLRSGADLTRVLADNNLRMVDDLLPSRGLYVVEFASSSKKKHKSEDKEIKELAKHESDIVWAEISAETNKINDDRFHAWPNGELDPVGVDPLMWTGQENLDYLRLDEVHSRATGRGVTVAVLDTGADFDHPSLKSHLSPEGYDYVDDDRFPEEERNGIDDDDDGQVDESYGHGTHTAGLVALVAPEAEILVYRVLDSDGNANPYIVAQAMQDAIDAGADVINVSFGMEGKPNSKVLTEVFKKAGKAEVVVVAAVGNEGRSSKQFPAEDKDVIGVAAMGNGNHELAGFSNHGKPALVAAPGENIVSTVPGGGFGAWSGTSMASPIVAGQVALVLSHDLDRKIKKVVEIVGKSSSKVQGKSKVEKGLIDILKSIDG